MHTPRSPEGSGSCAIIAAPASRSTLKVPIRFTRITVSNGSSEWGPRREATRSAQPIPAQQTLIRRPPGRAAAAATACPHLVGIGHVGSHELCTLTELADELGAALLR